MFQESQGQENHFFGKYLIWRLLHPDEEYIYDIPDAIVYYDDAPSRKGWIYSRGYFYKCNNLAEWMTLNECDALLDDTNSWIICDGTIPPEKPRCKMLVIASPEYFTGGTKGVKTFYESCPFEIYLPTWSFEEFEVVGRSLYDCNDDDIKEIKRRCMLYGGIPRFVLKGYQTKTTAKPLGMIPPTSRNHTGDSMM